MQKRHWIMLVVLAVMLFLGYSCFSAPSRSPQRPSPTRGPSPEQRQAVSSVQNYPIGASLGYKNLAECMAFILAVDSVTNNWQFESIGWYSEPSTATIWSVRYNFTKDGKATSASWNYDQRSGNVSGANEYGQLILSSCR